MSKHEGYIKEAYEYANNNIENEGGPFGAIIVKDGVIIGRGGNSVTRNNDPTAHAEVMAIRDACSRIENFDLSGCTIYSSCEPCPMCLSAIYWSRMEKVYYGSTKDDAADVGFSDAYIYEQLDKSIDERDITFTQVSCTTMINPFETWVNKTDKTPY